MNRRTLEEAIRCNPTNFTYKQEQHMITRNLMSHLIAAKPVVKSRPNPYAVTYYPGNSRIDSVNCT